MAGAAPSRMRVSIAVAAVVAVCLVIPSHVQADSWEGYASPICPPIATGCIADGTICQAIQNLGRPSSVRSYVRVNVRTGAVAVAEYLGGQHEDAWLVEGLCDYLSAVPSQECATQAILDEIGRAHV